MGKGSRVVGLVLLTCMCGCAHVPPHTTASRPQQISYYPFCVFGPDPKIATQEQLHKKLTDFIRGVAGPAAQISISPNERIVAVRTSSFRHRTLAKAWPRIACIGQTRYDVEYEQYKACVFLIGEALRGNGLPSLGAWSDGLRKQDTIYCGQPIGGT